MNTDLNIDFNGHFHSVSGKVQQEYVKWLRDMTSFQIFTADTKNEIPKKISVSKTINCPNCLTSLDSIYDGKTLKVIKPCPKPNGLPSLKTQLNIPSGYMVVGNDFRQEFKVIGEYDIGHALGVYSTIKQYAKVGLAHGYVGNTCPIIRKINSSSFVLGVDGDNKKLPGRKVGGICTDLWWYSIADKDEWERRFETKAKDDSYVDVIKCDPGLYEFNYCYYQTDRSDYNKPHVFLEINHIGPAKKVKDYKAQYNSLDLTAEQVFHYYFRKSPDFYGNPENFPKEECYASSVSKNYEASYPLGPKQNEWPFYFLSDRINNDSWNWHPNGWYCNIPEISKKEPEIVIPVFTKPFAWYNDGSNLGDVVEDGIHLNPSFARLVYNILQSVIRYGIYQYKDKSISKHCAGVEKAKKIFQQMKEIYPVPEFCKDLA